MSLNPVISGLTFDNFESMKSNIKTTISDVQKFINNGFNELAKSTFFIGDTHRFDIKQELIAKNAIWIAKKRYAMLVIDREGIPENKLEVKGIDIVRSSFPLSFVGFLKGLITSILSGMDKSDIDNLILDFEKSLQSVDSYDLCKNTSIKELHKYKLKNKSYYNSIFSDTIKGTPAHAKSCIYFNDLLKHLDLTNKYQPISSGEKILWCYLKRNEYGLESIACRGYEDPPEIKQFIDTYIDKNKMFESELKGKILEIYRYIGWIYPSEQTQLYDSFFD